MTNRCPIWYFLAFIATGICSCASLNTLPQAELESDYCEFRQSDSTYSDVYVDVSGDSLIIMPADKLLPWPSLGPNQLFRKKGFDIDVLIVPFKFRPTTSNFPHQLNTDFNLTDRDKDIWIYQNKPWYGLMLSLNLN